MLDRIRELYDKLTENDDYTYQPKEYERTAETLLNLFFLVDLWKWKQVFLLKKLEDKSVI